MSCQYHQPIMVKEVLAGLEVTSGGLYCDATAGGGGHSAAMLKACAPGGKLIALDQDDAAINQCRQKLEEFGPRALVIKANFGELAQVLKQAGASLVDGILVDLGVSSHQLDTPERGFSFSADGPLDMRMDQSSGESAAELIERLDEEELANVIYQLGEEPLSRKIARAIKQAQAAGELKGTAALGRVVAQAVGFRREQKRKGSGKKSIHPATRTFQALRMAVNDELGALNQLLLTFTQVLKPGGRIAIISFHSLEDRAVKQRFNELATGCICPPGLPICVCGHRPTLRVLTKRPIMAQEAELASNPRARSAKLRVAELLKE